MTKLNFLTTRTPDFSGFIFSVEAGQDFCVEDFAEAYNLNPSDIDSDDIKNAQKHAAELTDGEWLEVGFEA